MVEPTPTDAVIVDRGYRTYGGPRTGTRGAMRSVAIHGVRNVLGLGRAARHAILERRYARFQGLNLTYEVRESIMKHGVDPSTEREDVLDGQREVLHRAGRVWGRHVPERSPRYEGGSGVARSLR